MQNLWNLLDWQKLATKSPIFKKSINLQPSKIFWLNDPVNIRKPNIFWKITKCLKNLQIFDFHQIVEKLTIFQKLPNYQNHKNRYQCLTKQNFDLVILTWSPKTSKFSKNCQMFQFSSNLPKEVVKFFKINQTRKPSNC